MQPLLFGSIILRVPQSQLTFTKILNISVHPRFWCIVKLIGLSTFNNLISLSVSALADSVPSLTHSHNIGMCTQKGEIMTMLKLTLSIFAQSSPKNKSLLPFVLLVYMNQFWPPQYLLTKNNSIPTSSLPSILIPLTLTTKPLTSDGFLRHYNLIYIPDSADLWLHVLHYKWLHTCRSPWSK